MSVFDQPVTSYSDTSIRRQVITDVISMIDPYDTPLIDRLGGLDGASSKFRFAGGKSTKVEWIEDTLPALSTALNAATIGSAATSATVIDASVFEKGHIVLIDAQTFWVSTVDATLNTVGLTAIGGTLASHASAAVFYVVGMARVEGAESDGIGLPTKSLGTNYTQIFHQEVKVTRTMASYAQWGVADELEYQSKKVIPNLMRQIEKDILTVNTTSAGSATVGRVMGGIPYFVTTNTVSGASLAKSAFENACASSYADGGGPNWVSAVAPANFQKIRAWYESSNYLVVQRNDAVNGMPAPTQILTPFGNVDLLLDRWAPTGTIFLLDERNVGMMTYDPFARTKLASTGDYDREEVIGEFTLCLRQEPSHAVLGGVS